MPSKKLPPALSQHLLAEAQRFLFYPDKLRRTRTNLEAQALLDRLGKKLVEWRKTFTPSAAEEFSELFAQPALLDELYCREMLASVPDIVARTQRLSRITFEGADKDASRYLREAATCLVAGLPQAAVALARAAVEQVLRKSAAKRFGREAAAEPDLKELIDDLARRGQLLDREDIALAHKVRRLANDVLHDGTQASEDDSFQTIEAARHLIRRLSLKG